MTLKEKDGKIPAGKVLVAVKRFRAVKRFYEVPATFPPDGKVRLVGPYSDKVYRTPIGKWSRRYERLALCMNGWHVTNAKRAGDFGGEVVFVVEVRGSVLRKGCDSKAAVSQIRLIKRIGVNPPAVDIAAAVAAHVREANRKTRKARAARAARKVAA